MLRYPNSTRRRAIGRAASQFQQSKSHLLAAEILARRIVVFQRGHSFRVLFGKDWQHHSGTRYGSLAIKNSHREIMLYGRSTTTTKAQKVRHHPTLNLSSTE